MSGASSRFQKDALCHWEPQRRASLLSLHLTWTHVNFTPVIIIGKSVLVPTRHTVYVWSCCVSVHSCLKGGGGILQGHLVPSRWFTKTEILLISIKRKTLFISLTAPQTLLSSPPPLIKSVEITDDSYSRCFYFDVLPEFDILNQVLPWWKDYCLHVAPHNARVCLLLSKNPMNFSLLKEGW